LLANIEKGFSCLGLTKMKKHNPGQGLFINYRRQCHIPKQPGDSHYSDITKPDSPVAGSKYSHTPLPANKKPTGCGGLFA
jgi:hypothetical protein